MPFFRLKVCDLSFGPPNHKHPRRNGTLVRTDTDIACIFYGHISETRAETETDDLVNATIENGCVRVCVCC